MRDDDDEIQHRPSLTERSKFYRRASGNAFGNIMFWLAIEGVALFLFRYIVFMVSDHDILDFDNSKNKIFYVFVIGATLWWLREQLSVEGIYELGEKYNREYKPWQLEKIKRDNEKYDLEQNERRARMQRS